MSRRVLIVDAFTDEPLRGNAAGVVPDANGLHHGQMQAIADELGASETAFLVESETADRRVQYFTPTQEVDLCGHATIASHALLAEEGLEDGMYTLETNVGTLDVEVDGETVWMTQKPPEIREVEVDYRRVATALGMDEVALTELEHDLPLARSSTGLPFLMIPVTYLEHLSAMAPDMAAITELTEETDSTGVFVFTFDTLDGDSTLHARMFAPGAGVSEDPVTGTASGACGAYLDRYGAFDPTPAEMTVEQGHFLDRGGRVRVEASHATTDGVVRVGGTATVSLDGELTIPDRATDDIIEA